MEIYLCTELLYALSEWIIGCQQQVYYKLPVLQLMSKFYLCFFSEKRRDDDIFEVSCRIYTT